MHGHHSWSADGHLHRRNVYLLNGVITYSRQKLERISQGAVAIAICGRLRTILSRRPGETVTLIERFDKLTLLIATQRVFERSLVSVYLQFQQSLRF
jgi:hypothetical protein